MIPYIKSVWKKAKSTAQAFHGFGQVNKKLFFAHGTRTSAGLQPCMKSLGTPGHGQSKFGPVCAGEPSAVNINAYGHGKDKRTGRSLMVSAALTGQEGDVHLSHMLKLVQDVVSGKIH